MLNIPEETRQAISADVASMKAMRRPYWTMWRDIAREYLPYVHPWLINTQKGEKISLNPDYITSVGLRAGRVATAGLMNGITSPTRPWFKGGIGADASLLSWSSRQWLQQVTQIMYSVLAQSNYYNTAASGYFDLNFFNISGHQIFENTDELFRVQRFNVGEFYVAYDEFGKVRAYAREVKMKLRTMAKRFGKENLPPELQEQLKNPNSLNSKKTVLHFCERSHSMHMFNHFADRRPWREVYMLQNVKDSVLEIKGYKEQPATFPRWNEELGLGVSPAMDALADMRELKQILIEKGIGLEKMADPPMLYDSRLANEPKSSLPGGRTYVQNLGEATGARELYRTQMPFQELRADANALISSIQEMFHNDLFKMIAQLDTVRSATEIDARREEKLVLLAHFLERFESEKLDPDLNRIFNICLRAGIFPDPPRELLNVELKFEYISILSSVQRAVNTVPTERLLQMVGNVAGLNPQVLDLVDFDELIYAYGTDVGAHATIIRDNSSVKQLRAQREEQNAALEASATAETAIAGAKTLSETDVGGGANALQALLS